MKGGSEEAIVPSQYTFSLRATSHKTISFNLHHDFKPLKCEKTFKLQSTIPSYHSDCALPFQPDAALPEFGLKYRQEEIKQSPFLMVPKPASRYCQVCKERFQDYLKHVSHPLHLQKVREGHSELDLNLIKELLNKTEVKRKTSILRSRPDFDQTKQFDDASMKSEEEENFEQSFTCGSKKRIVVNNEGDIEALSLSGSTKALQDFGLGSAKKTARRGPVSKQTFV